MLYSIARYCFRNWIRIFFVWTVILIAVSILSISIGPDWFNPGALSNTESSKALELLRKKLPEQASLASGHTGTIVFQHNDGILDKQDKIEAYIQGLVADKNVTKVQNVISPFDPITPQISNDKTVGYATIIFSSDVPIEGIGKPSVERASDLRKEMTVEFGGKAFSKFEFPANKLVGILGALFILIIAFGSLVAAGLPIISALIGIGIGSSLVVIWSNFASVPNMTAHIAAMIALGVGIDYALFIVTRYRESINNGSDRGNAVIEAMTTAGLAVLFAGITTVVSIMGMLILNIDLISGVGVGVSIAVVVMVLIALTLVPAALGSPLGKHLEKFSFSRKLSSPDEPTIWLKWIKFIQSRALPMAIVGLVVLIVLASPILSLRVGVTDEGNAQEKLTTRRAYDILSKGFGQGSNGPIVAIVDLTESKDPKTLERLVTKVEGIDGVQRVLPSSAQISFLRQGSNIQVTTSKDLTREQQARIDELNQVIKDIRDDQPTITPIRIIPKTSPQDSQTRDLVHDLRDNVVPIIEKETGSRIYLTGVTAGNIDFADVMSSRAPMFIAVVLILSFFLLVVMFRSISVAIKAVVFNLLSIGAAYGVVIAVFQWGWGAKLLGIGEPGPIEPWAPVMLFAIVFGLSMDYEVFLISKIKEKYSQTKDNTLSLTYGFSSTARVIISAALIMACVFGSFIFVDDRALKLVGLGLSVAVLVDAIVVRMLLLPASMEILGDRNWWFPKWLEKIIPTIKVGHLRTSKENQPIKVSKK